jgi:hypothetical protein
MCDPQPIRWACTVVSSRRMTAFEMRRAESRMGPPSPFRPIKVRRVTRVSSFHKRISRHSRVTRISWLPLFLQSRKWNAKWYLLSVWCVICYTLSVGNSWMVSRVSRVIRISRISRIIRIIRISRVRRISRAGRMTEVRTTNGNLCTLNRINHYALNLVVRVL